MTPTKIFISISVISIAILIYILNFHAPAELGAFGVLIVFLLLYVIFTAVSTLGIQQARLAIHRSKNIRGNEADITYRVSYYYASVLALAPLLLLSLRSVGRLNLTSLVLVSILIGIISLYVSRQIK